MSTFRTTHSSLRKASTTLVPMKPDPPVTSTPASGAARVAGAPAFTPHAVLPPIAWMTSRLNSFGPPQPPRRPEWLGYVSRSSVFLLPSSTRSSSPKTFVTGRCHRPAAADRDLGPHMDDRSHRLFGASSTSGRRRASARTVLYEDPARHPLVGAALRRPCRPRASGLGGPDRAWPPCGDHHDERRWSWRSQHSDWAPRLTGSARPRAFHPISTPKRYATSWSMLADLRRRATTFDIIHVHYLYRFHGMAAAAVALLHQESRMSSRRMAASILGTASTSDSRRTSITPLSRIRSSVVHRYWSVRPAVRSHSSANLATRFRLGSFR